MNAFYIFASCFAIVFGGLAWCEILITLMGN